MQDYRTMNGPQRDQNASNAAVFSSMVRTHSSRLLYNVLTTSLRLFHSQICLPSNIVHSVLGVRLYWSLFHGR